MKKQKPKSRTICRKREQNEPEIDQEHQKQVNALATQFKGDQLKLVLQRCYSNVQKYGPEAIMKAVDSSTFIQIGDEVAQKHMEENLEVAVRQAYGTSHNHEETSKRNALFLIESSEGLIDYDFDTLIEMKRAYEKGHYDDVADLAYLHDRRRRRNQPERRINDNATLCREKPKSPWQLVSELLTEVAEEDQKNESPLKCCVEAVRHLSRDLTYDNRMAAKDSIRKAIKCLEE